MAMMAKVSKGLHSANLTFNMTGGLESDTVEVVDILCSAQLFFSLNIFDACKAYRKAQKIATRLVEGATWCNKK